MTLSNQLRKPRTSVRLDTKIKMEQLSKNPVYGAVWRELDCCMTLGLKWQFFWTLPISLLPEGQASLFKFIAILCLAWKSITKYEMISGGPYTVPNAAQRFSVSTLLLLLVLNLLGYVPFPDGATHLPLKGLPLESELTTFFKCFLLFLCIRTLWNFGILVTEGWSAIYNLIMVADPAAVWDRSGRNVLDAGAKLGAALRRVTDANGAHINWILFCAMDAACREVDCLLVMGLIGSAIFVVGYSCLQLILGLSFRFLIIVYCVATLNAFNQFYVASVSCNTSIRLGVRYSINLGLLAILILIIPRNAEKNTAIASCIAFVAMRLVHLTRVVWDLGTCRRWCWWTWSPEAQSKLSLLPLALCFVLLKLFRKAKTVLFGGIQSQRMKNILHEAGKWGLDRNDKNRLLWRGGEND